MSVEATSWAWRQPVRGTKKLVLLCLADWADPLHRSWHATGELADRVGVTQGDEGSVLDRQEVEEVARGPVDVGDLSRKLDLDEHDVHDCLLLLVEEVSAATSRLQGELIAKPVNEGFSKTVNVALRQALEAGQDAVLVNAEVEFIDSGWLDVMRARVGEDDAPASVVGARLLYPSGLIQHGGIFFSLLHVFDHRFRYAPADLPEALYALTAPVTGALQLIRHEALTEVGLYDESFQMGLEDVDFCLRVFESGRSCVYEPTVRAFHHESLFRGRPSPKGGRLAAALLPHVHAQVPGDELRQMDTDPDLKALGAEATREVLDEMARRRRPLSSELIELAQLRNPGLQAGVLEALAEWERSR